jgi:hypothetical protein
VKRPTKAKRLPLDGPRSYKLSPDHRAAIAAAVPSKLMPDDTTWAELEQIVEGFRTLKRRRQRHPIPRELARWNRLAALNAELIAQLCQIPVEPWRTATLESLSKAADRIAVRRDYYATLSTAFARKRDPDKQFLYWGVLDVWKGLGGELKFSTDRHGLPSGPFVRFFHACVAPILGNETPSASGIADIIRRARRAKPA